MLTLLLLMKSIQFIQWDRNHFIHLQSLIQCIGIVSEIESFHSFTIPHLQSHISCIVIVISRLFVSKPVFITESITESVFVSVSVSITVFVFVL